MKPSTLHKILHTHSRFFSSILSPPPSTCRRLHAAAASTVPPDPLHYLGSVCSLIGSLSKNPMNYKTLTTLDSFLAQTHIFTPAISVIAVDFLCQSRKIQRAKAVVFNLKRQGNVSDHFLYGLVFDFLVKDGNFDDVEMVWAEICGSKVRIHASDYVIHVCKYGNADELKKVCYRVMMGGRVILERQSFVALIGALCNVNECGLAKEVSTEMLNRGIPVDDLSYLVIFKCFCRNGAVIEADLILRKLVKPNFHFGLCIYGSFLQALCKSGKSREANKLFQKLIKNGSSSSDMLRKAGVVKNGRRAIFQMSCEVPKVTAYEAYFRSLCSVGRINDAENLLKDMMNTRNVLEVCVYGSFIKALFRAGRGEDALKFFKVESKKGRIRREDMVRYVIKGLCDNGRVEEALEILRDVTKGGKTISAFSSSFNQILGSYWSEGRIVEAERLFCRLEGGGSFGVSDVCNYFEIMINGYCDRGNVSQALGLLKEMISRKARKVHVKQTLYALIIRGLCEEGRLEEGLRCFDAMLENENAVSGMVWRELLHPLLRLDDVSSKNF